MENLKNESGQDNNSVSHTLNILKAASPYVDIKAKHSVNLLMKAAELMDSFQNPDVGDLSACSVNNGNGDMEGMLNSVREFCTSKEQDLVDMILNFTKAQKFYHTYQMVSSAGQGGKAAAKNPYAKMLGLDENAGMMDMLSSMLTPEQKSTFESLNMILSAMPANS